MKSFTLAFISAIAVSQISLGHYVQDSSDYYKRPEIKQIETQKVEHISRIHIKVDVNQEGSGKFGQCHDKIKPCPKIIPGRYGFRCKKKFFDNEKILKAGDEACLQFRKNKQKSPFPSAFTAFEYDVEGPYFEWPINRNGRFWNAHKHSKYRIVFTENCDIVGAVRRKHKNRGPYERCEVVPL